MPSPRALTLCAPIAAAAAAAAAAADVFHLCPFRSQLLAEAERRLKMSLRKDYYKIQGVAKVRGGGKGARVRGKGGRGGGGGGGWGKGGLDLFAW